MASLPLHVVLKALGPVPHLGATLFLTGLGIWAAERTAVTLGEEDPSSVVIDEVVGTLIALGIAGQSSLARQALAFALFRLLDITKPGIIDRAQAWRPAGLGIMADDVLAGIAAGMLARFSPLGR